MSKWNRIKLRFDELSDQANGIEQGRKTTQVEKLKKVSLLEAPIPVTGTKTTIDSESYYQ